MAAGAVGLSMLFERLLLPAVVLLILLFGYRLVTRSGFYRTPADWGIGGLILLIPVTLWASALPEITIPQILRLLTGIGIFYAIINGITTQQNLKFSILVISFLGIILALIGLVNTTWILGKLPLIPGSLYSRLPTILADTIHPNVLAGFLVILIPIIVAILLFAWRDLSRRERFFHTIAALLISLLILLTQSRGAISAFFVIVGVLIALRWKYGWVAVVILALIAIIAITTIGTSAFIDQADITGDSAKKLDGRIEIWSRGIYMLTDFPITGIGMGLFGEIADALFPFFVNRPGSVPHAHNLFLQIGVDLGIPGLISWVSILLIIGFTCWRLYRNAKPEPWMAGLGAGILCSQIGLAVHGMTDSVTWGMVKLAPIVWGIWGFAIAAWFIFRSVEHNATRQPFD